LETVRDVRDKISLSINR